MCISLPVCTVNVIKEKSLVVSENTLMYYENNQILFVNEENRDSERLNMLSS